MELKVVKISEIDLGERAREDLGNIDELVESIKEKGIIQPLAVALSSVRDKPYLLLCGGRRLVAAAMAGLEEVPVRIYDEELSPLEKKIIELEENIRRKDLTWQEQVALEKKIHDLHTALHGEKTARSPDAEGWSKRDTAKLTERSPASVTRDIHLAEAVEAFPEVDWANVKDKNEADKVLRKLEETLIRRELAQRVEQETPKGKMAVIKRLSDAYIVGDFFEKVKEIPDGSIDFVDIDPPYSIGLDGSKKDIAYGSMDHYRDIPEKDFLPFLDKALGECYRVMAEHSWLVLWFAPDPWFEPIAQLLEKYGFKFRRQPAAWTKMSHSAQSWQPSTYLARSYEMFFYAAKGNPILAKPGARDEFSFAPVPGKEKISPVEKPFNLMFAILGIFSVEGGRVMVPFAGSGTTLLAAHRLGMSPIGFDLVKEYKEAYVVKVYEMIEKEEEWAKKEKLEALSRGRPI